MAFNHQAGDTRFTVEWNAAKDQALWDMLSRPAKGDDIDWKALAESFDVTLPFLLQQAAWLYDRQLSQVRAQMRRVGTTHSTSPSPAPGSMAGSAALGGQQPKGISATGQRAPSRLVSQPKDTLPQRSPRRTSSTTTINQLKSQKEMSRNETPPADTKDTKWEGYGRRPSINRKEQAVQALLQKSPTLEEEDLSSSESESESDSDGDVMLSRTGPRFKRFGKLSTHRPGLRDDEEDEDESPAFLPLAREKEEARREPSGQDLNATLRLEAEHAAAQRRRLSEQESIAKKPITADSSTSSVSSGPNVRLRQGDSRRVLHQSGGAFGPQKTAEPARSSPRRSIASGKDSSDTPSMGSSFSDLDDASVTQSALEEALMSNMQHGGMASRMSTISQALRSRYL
ncbi:multidomain presynaptic cytomatrix related protein [Aspergillus fumigatus A1163]|uniref:Autophagy-related protein 29 n=2 Tax=Aspergillus fumigatus TaxID=746128 RepID=Q4WWV8_ASPFU|nr:multidomain presynaptic cytomatrix related protein [Aspergillus fumigatus Af293]EAL92845.1 multidomain presynaptic cytomatrix related protein [Aspergillus fumigatus Af293]EDP53011.1 multidomain presynaptic cytomatrix related protein [Aspergillus fumigatus A1163]KEY78627.1 multidomain presynaptic cytomatrix related protein [Aspergillus fumigatus]